MLRAQTAKNAFWAGYALITCRLLFEERELFGENEYLCAKSGRIFESILERTVEKNPLTFFPKTLISCKHLFCSLFLYFITVFFKLATTENRATFGQHCVVKEVDRWKMRRGAFLVFRCDFY